MMAEQQYILEDPVKKITERPEILPGTEKVKDPFTEGQKKQAGFAVRMEKAIQQLEALENSGFNPVNIMDTLKNNIPFVPEAIENWMSSPEYKQYQRARLDFATAQLRQETGAQINAGEIVWIDKTYFPEFGDDRQTILNKRQARRDALAAMIGQAGKAYDRTKAGIKENEYGFESEAALDELKKRAQSNPELKRKLIERGLINE
tara:strand:- start:1826 stop:2440 length:615 start_codon:yes stop_codon:yes gene_type:complete